MSPTVTNKKTSFDADANSDYSPKTYTVGGEELQAVVLNSSAGDEIGTVANPLRAEVVGTISTKTDLAPSAPAAVSVGVASGVAVAANASRKGLILTNTSTATISLGFGAAAVLNSGVTLYPSGVFCMGEYDFDTGDINAIASAAASNLAIQEFA